MGSHTPSSQLMTMSAAGSGSSHSSSNDDESTSITSSGSDGENVYVVDDDDDETFETDPRARPSPFVTCSRLANAVWVKRNTYTWNNCVEYELRPGATLEDVAVHSSSASRGSESGSLPTAPAATPKGILNQVMGPATDGLRVLWLSRFIFLAKGHSCDELDKESGNRLALIVEAKCISGNVLASFKYSVYCPTRLPSENVGESIAVVDWVLTLIAGWTCWRRMAISTRRTLRPCSASTEVLKMFFSAPHPDGGMRDLLLDYHGLSDDQWREMFRCLHPATRLTVTEDMADSDNNCLASLLDAIREGYGPRRLAVQCGDRYAGTQIEDLGSTISTSGSAVKNISISATKNPRDAFLALFKSLATPTTGLRKLEVEHACHTSSNEGWECIWNFAATSPALSSVRVWSSRHLPDDPLPAIKAAVRSNRRLTTVAVNDAEGPYHETPEYKKRVLPLLRSNRICSLTRDVKECPDASWRVHLFAASLLRLCGAKQGKEVRTSRSFVAKLLRGNPDLLESCSRVSDVLRRQWDDHMRAAAFHLERVAHLELRMAQSGTEIPKKRPHPQSAA